MPRTSSSAPPPLPLLLPEKDSKAAAMTNRTTPGSAATCFGGAGLPGQAGDDRNPAILAGREAAK